MSKCAPSGQKRSRFRFFPKTYALFLIAVVFALPASGTPQDEIIAKKSKAALPETIKLYEWFHQNPELSEQESQTAARFASELRQQGMEIHPNLGGHGFVGVLKNRLHPKGPVVLYRADMDALPIQEKTGVAYASQNQGKMHACGHDIHMATAVGMVSILREVEHLWSGTLLFVGQPSEEIGKGAKQVLANKKFKELIRRIGRPKVALALHDAADIPAGTVSLLGGFANANVDSVNITVFGKGGHGARPQDTIDPIVIGAHIVTSLQTIVSRRLPPGEPAVVTVGQFSGGSKHNIIPPDAILLLTVRSYSDETRNQLLSEIKKISTHTARAHGATRDPKVEILDEWTPAAFNDPKWTKAIRTQFQESLGKKNVLRHEPSLGGEDFGRYARQLKIPGVMWKLGAAPRRTYAKTGGKGMPGLHSDRWLPEKEPTLQTGMRSAVTAVLFAFQEKD
jgi:amidohydrolase